VVPVLQIDVVETGELGDRSYVAHDGSTAIVVDPQRDLDRMDALLSERGVTPAAVAETHIHNDYVTGGFELARRARADYLLAAADEVRFARRAVAGGDALAYGGLTVRVIATPGHTHNHLAYVVTAAGDDRVGVFTGGSLLYGSVGRTDLLGSASTDALTRAQFRSARTLATLVPDNALVYPTHGFGSFCSSGSASGGGITTLAQEKARNDAFAVTAEDEFVERLLGGLTAYPAYYAHMAARNLAGPGPADLTPATQVGPAELRRRIDAGEWVVDLRHRRSYAAAHLPGSIGIELGRQFSTYLGWLLPWGSPLTLIGESDGAIADAQRQLTRIGIERPAGAATGSVEAMRDGSPLGSYACATFGDLQRSRDAVVLDVRRDDERAAGHIPGSIHIPLHALLHRLEQVPDGRVWVHCASGYRASIAASLLARAGRDVVLVDDDVTAAARAGASPMA
jgi:hydroxyacylglutathione hydrolase